MLKPKLLLLADTVLTDRRYTYGEHILMDGTYRYGGLGVATYANDRAKISILLERVSELYGSYHTYDDIYAYDASEVRYDGLDVRQDDGPQLENLVVNSFAPQLMEIN